MTSENRLAAIDLGSNSFRLEIGVLDHGEFQRTEYIKETVRQGAGLDADRNLTASAMQNGWDCLARFGERLAGFAPAQVRAVATQTLREARNRDAFLERANTVLGFPIDVISGREEARLIYQGVAHTLAPSDERRLVIDIGGRSTELILGQGFKPRVMESFRVGSIAWSTRYFGEGQFTRKSFEIAEIAAKAVLDETLDAYHPSHWDVAYGSAGTIGAISDVLKAAGWPQGVITQESLDWLLERLLNAQSADRLKLPGMREDRKAVIGGGLSVTRALFSLLGIQSLHPTDGGLRHGLLCELRGNTDWDATIDLRVKTVARLATKFGVDRIHAARVGQVAIALFSQLAATQRSTPSEDAMRSVRKIKWAAELHEIGSHISHSDYHKHGAYILDNADAMGFSLPELHRLSLLVLGHRGKLRKLEADLANDDLRAQLLALRLAVILCHARRDPDLSGLTLTAAPGGKLQLQCAALWAKEFPQSAYLLREEALAWQKTSWPLDFAEI
jgi:exopolyphosphatase/guanosine-5'-triphosphate,3'-diphosphate pyrophosphatase